MYRPTRRQDAKPQVPLLSDRAAHAPEKGYIQQHCKYSVLPHDFHARGKRGGQLEYPQDVKVRDDPPSRAPPRSTLRLLRRSKPVPRSFH